MSTEKSRFVRLEQPSSTGRTKFIELTLEPPTLHREWGLVGGKTQKTSHTYDYVNKGKSNELTPEEASIERFDRLVAKKQKEGYRTPDQVSESEQVKGLDFTYLPTEFCCSKPIQKLAPAKIDKGRCKFFMKYNGLCHYILIDKDCEVRIYTRRMDDHTAKYPDIVEDVKKKNFPAGTVLISELTVPVCLESKQYLTHMESFKRISEIAKKDTLEGKLKEDQTESLRRQERHPVYAVVFGVLYYDGKPIWETHTYDEMYKTYIQDLVGRLTAPEPMPFTTLDEAQAFLKDTGDRYEGLVAWMLDEKMEVSFNGKPKRRAAYKVKVSKEMDVIAYDWVEGKGDRQGVIGALKIGEYLPDGTWKDLGTVGSGIEDADAEPSLWEFPCVIEVKYDNRFPTGKFQFPRFVKVHEDKTVKDLSPAA